MKPGSLASQAILHNALSDTHHSQYLLREPWSSMNNEGQTLQIAERKEEGKHRPLTSTFLRSSWLIGTLIFLIAMGFNCYQLGRPSLWFDEVYSVALVQHPFSQVWQIIFGWQPNMELYYLLLHGWINLLGRVGLAPTEFAVRFPSAFFAALSAVVVFAFGRRFISTATGILGALIYLLNPHELIYAQQTRAYGLQLFLLCLSWYLLFAVLTSNRCWSRYWIGYSLVMILAIYTQLMSGLMLMTQVLALGGMVLFPHRRTLILQRIPAFVGSLVIVGIALLPLMPVIRYGDTTDSWLPAPKLHDIYWILRVITGGDSWYLCLTATSILLGILIVGLSILWRTSHSKALLAPQLEKRPALQDLVSHEYSGIVIWGLFCWLFVPIILSYIISITLIHVFSDRYLVIIVPAFGLLVSLGVTTLRGRTIIIHAVQALLALVLVAYAFHLSGSFYANAQIEDWRTAAQWVEDRYHQHDGLVCYDNNNGCQIGMEYYFQTYPKNGTHFDADTPGATRFWTPAYFANADEAVTPSILSAYAAKYQRLFYITGRGAVPSAILQWLDQHYRLIGQMHADSNISVRLYEIGSLHGMRNEIVRRISGRK